MLRAVQLLSKVFLHHLTPLLGLPSFSALWLRALELLQSYLHAPNNETLTEAVPEHLKNLLFVMATQGAFDNGGPPVAGAGGDQTLAAMTKAVIDSWKVEELASVWEEAVGSKQAEASAGAD